MKNKTLIIILIVIVGIIIPFVPYVHVIEMFYLLIPFVIILLSTFIYLIVSFFHKEMKSREIAFKVILLPTFIASQFLSGFTVDKVQRKRCNRVITEIEELHQSHNQYPTKHPTKIGIEYIKNKESDEYHLEYTRGFFVTEKYDSSSKKWKSHGWND